MIRMRLFGGPVLQGAEGQELHSVLAQAKRTALLGYLALAGPGFQRRDQLLAVFWPESDEERARRALRQATFFLRRSLGADAILSRGDDELGLNDELVTCDVTEFEDRIRHGRLAEAVELYRGPLLPGFHVDGLSELDRFLETHRARLHRLAIEASGRLVDELVVAGRTDDAVRFARWRVELAPVEPEPVGRLIGLLTTAGDGAGALRAYEEHASRLAVEYELEPDPAVQSLISQLRWDGSKATAGPGAGRPRPALHGDRVPGTTDGEARVADPASSPTPGEPADPAAKGTVRPGSQPPHATGSPTYRRRPFLPLAWLTGLVAITAVATQIPRMLERPDAETIAMFPLRVVSADSALQFLGDGVSTLAAMAFTGEIGPRLLDMRRSIRELAAAGSTREAARRLGATWYIDGSIVETVRGIQVSVALCDAATNRILVLPPLVGPVDSFPTLAHRLATELMVMVTGQEPHLVNSYFMDAPFAVTRAYVSGIAAYRHGDYYRAERDLMDAIGLDSTSAPIAFALMLTSGWTGETPAGPLSRRLAWKLRDELPDQEREYVEAMIGGLPATRFSGVTDPLRALERWEAYVQHWPDDQDGWYELGDRYFHGGAMAGYTDYLDRAERAFRKALALDPSLAQASVHLVDVLVHKAVVPGVPGGELEALRTELRSRADTHFRQVAPDARFSTGAAWRASMALDDETWQRQIEARTESMPRPELNAIIRSSLGYGWPMDDAERAAGISISRAITGEDWRTAIVESANVELNAGRPAAADRAADEMRERVPDRPIHLFMKVEAALLGDGDADVAAAAAVELERIAASPAAPDPFRRQDQFLAGFLAETWKLTHGDTSTARATIERVRKGIDQDTAVDARFRPLGDFFTAFLEALVAVTEKRPDALRKAVVADSVLRRHWGETESPWHVVWPIEGMGPVLIIRLHQLRGDDESALAAARRRGIPYTSAGSGTWFLSTRLLVEARAAARLGDDAGARRAYTHYLALRTDPEPRLRSQRDSAIAELEALAGR